MAYRVKRIVSSAVRKVGRLALSGKNACLRILPASRPPVKTVKKAGSGRPEVGTVPEDSPRSVQQTVDSGSSKNSRSGPRAKKKQKPRWSLDDFSVVPLPGRSRFHDFTIDLRIMRGIAQQGFQYCTPIQEKALPRALDARDLVGRAQTGTGKTAVFLIALYCRLLADKSKWPPVGQPRALIIAPTRELVIQIAKEGKKLGAFSPLKIAAVYGGADYRKQSDLLRSQRCDIIAATPGRLLDFIRQEILVLDHCVMLVIDEADRMLDMGFIPDVRKIINKLPEKAGRQTMLFSATITDDVRRLADQWCNKPDSIEAGEQTVDVERIDQRIYLTTEKEKYTLLYNLAKVSAGKRMLVFTNMKSEAMALVKRLSANGIGCQLLTGDVPQNKRMSRLEAFRSGKNHILVATDVAGRGIHIDEISYVVNYTLPEDPEDYVHRIGRTGRAGADGIAVSFACEAGSFNLPAIETFINRSLDCIVPGEDLLIPPPEPDKSETPSKTVGHRNHRSRNRPHRPIHKKSLR